MSTKGVFFIIIYLIFVIVVIYWIFVSPLNKEAAVAVAIFMFSVFGALLFKPIRNDLEDFINNLFIQKSIYRILIFGRPGSGKTTFIETAFTFIDPNSDKSSTDTFNYYKFKVQLQRNELNLRKFTDVAIADYKGQKPSQVIINNSADFFGAEGSRVLNAIIFIVDLVPRKNDEQGNPLNDESLLEWLKNGSMLDKIRARVEEHYEYINEASLELLFTSLHSNKLKSVMFVINKIDLIDKLINDGYLTISNFQNYREYAKHHFERMIKNIYRACDKLKIEDFSNKDSLVFTASARSRDDLRPLIVHLLRKGS